MTDKKQPSWDNLKPIGRLQDGKFVGVSSPDYVPVDKEKSNSTYQSPLTPEEQARRDALWANAKQINYSRVPQQSSSEPQLQGKQGVSGIAQDIRSGIVSGIEEIPSMAFDAITQLPGEAYGAGKQLVTDPSRLSRNIMTGMAETGQAIGQSPQRLAAYLAKKGLIQDRPAYHPTKRDFSKTFGVQDQQPGDVFIRGGAGFSPFGVAGELGELSALGRAAARSGAAGSYSGLQGENPIAAAGLGAVSEGMMKAPGKLPKEALLKSLAGNLSNEQLAANLRAARGTKLDLGEVIGSPKLKKSFHNFIAPAFGSGADQRYSQVGSKLSRRGERFLNDIANKENLDRQIDPDKFFKDTIIKAKNVHANEKRNRYRKFDQQAKAEGFSPNIDNFLDVAKGKYDLIKHNDVLKSIPGFENLLTKSDDYRSIRGKQPYSTVELKGLKNDLRSTAKNLGKSTVGSEKALAKHYSELSSALNDDINSSIREGGSPELQEAYNDAEKYYENDFSRFLEDDLQDYLDEDKPSEVIAHQIIKPSKNLDKYETIDKVQALLPERHKNLLADTYLRKALQDDGTVNMSDLSARLNKLGPRQTKALFEDPSTREQLGILKDLNKMSGASVSRMANPQTGVRAAENLMKISQLSGALHGGLSLASGDITSGLAQIAGPAAVAHALTKGLTNEKARASIVKALMKKQKEKGGARAPAPEALLGESLQQPQNVLSRNDMYKKALYNFMVPTQLTQQREDQK